jgi:hypothetical protein
VPDSYESILYGDTASNTTTAGIPKAPVGTYDGLSSFKTTGSYTGDLTNKLYSNTSNTTGTGNGTQPPYAKGPATVVDGKMYDSTGRLVGQYDYSKTSGVAYGGLALAGFGAYTSYINGNTANRLAKDTLKENKLNNRATYGSTQTQVNNNIDSVNNLRAYLGDTSKLARVKDYDSYAPKAGV